MLLNTSRPISENTFKKKKKRKKDEHFMGSQEGEKSPAGLKIELKKKEVKCTKLSLKYVPCHPIK